MKKAFIMAAGVGERLRPLTSIVPKPMVPIANKPVMEHTIELLKKHNYEELYVNLFYRADTIKKHFGTGKKWNVNINYSQEKELMGTAGGVRKAYKHFDDYFIVMSGDGITDIDLTAVLKFHIEKKSFATMVLKELDSKFDYGVTILDKDSRIKKFIEKPSWKDVFSNTVNTGIYIFSPEIFKYIPENKHFDFGNDVWPALLEKGENIFGYITKDYWCDIGNISEYKRAQKDAMDLNIKINILGDRIKENIWIDKLTKINKKVLLKSPCIIGENCITKDHSVIGPYTVISKNSIIYENTVIENSILWDKVVIEKNVKLKNCIIGHKGIIKESISIFEGSVLNVQD